MLDHIIVKQVFEATLEADSGCFSHGFTLPTNPFDPNVDKKQRIYAGKETAGGLKVVVCICNLIAGRSHSLLNSFLQKSLSSITIC
ncbi:hypothetical protein RchiOBHm_Chr2g0148631 [Rosa chinensis]|uniref:Uncharacterized protein n=1 Tax=Rosa chinensis TaxID=74649 RepID=A0A2P6RZG9_ROSCH|nr:hypothetical protein RchiOBHm_Chr2g0148631 [Rosa chinensis]